MNLKRLLRTYMTLLLIGLFVFGLTSCQLPASKGPQTTSGTSEGFPVPGETGQAPGGIDASTFATQTAQAIPQVVITSLVPTQDLTQASPYPIATNEPGAPAPTSTPITYVEATPGGPPSSYTLQEGEFPFCIARRFDVNQSELLTLNGLAVNTFVYAGQVLQIPQTGNPFDGTRALHDHPTTYTVHSGDTLGSIACYFGDVSPDMIALQNNLSSNDVSPGTELVIP